ncbi:MAG: DinB superfamily protein, partial [Frankiales bacterium]|nr:DinB superfamily protein [Frankiales bacterium]
MPETFSDQDLRGARFDRCDLSGAVMRGVILEGADLDAPWLLGEGSTLLVNGIDVVPFVRAELARQFPGHESRLAQDPDGLRQAYEVVQEAWQRALHRAA